MISLLLLLQTELVAGHGGDSTHFRAAVYEHAVQDVDLNSLHPTQDEIWRALAPNTKPLTQAVVDASRQGANIIVFPEYAVTGFNWNSREDIRPLLEDIPSVESNAIPCATFPEKTIQHWLSCSAQKHKMYIAANVGDLKKCALKNGDCPADGAFQYNTNVVYDPTGKIVHRYHKINPYGFEKNFMDAGKIGQKQLVFTTPFGRMSSMVCFDIGMKHPGVPLTAEDNIDTMLFLTAWMNKFPHFNGIQYHSSWSTRHGVNLLASETHRRSWRMTGSGLYTPTGAISYTYDTETENPKLLVADMPIHPRKVTFTPSLRQENEWAAPSFQRKYYNYVPLLNQGGEVRVCKGNICCTAAYTFSKGASTHEYYALGASYVRSYHKVGSLEICVLLKCKGSSGCGEFVSDTKAAFESIALRGNFSSNLVYPSVLLSGLKLATEGQFDVSTLGAISSQVAGLPVVNMVLLGRNYDKKYYSR